MDYTSSLIWLSVWPFVIYIAYRFCFKNVQKFDEEF